MPCHHRLRNLISEDKRLILSNYYPHWHIVELIPFFPDAFEKPEDQLPVVMEQLANNVANLPNHHQRATIEHLHHLSRLLPWEDKGPPSTSTKRNLSGFEYVEQSQKRRKADKCSACGGVGHRKNSKSCPNLISPSTFASAIHQNAATSSATKLLEL